MNKPNIYKNIPADKYHADPCDRPSLNASLAVTLLRKTPFHAWKEHPKLNPYWSYKDDKKFDTGTAAHHLILEGGHNLVELDFPNYRTNASKEARKKVLITGKIPLLKKEMRLLAAMKSRFDKTVDQNDEIPDITTGAPEVTIMWEESGLPMRSRLDLLLDGWVVDYKTTTDADPLSFMKKKIPELSYDVRAAFYLRGIEKLTGKPHKFLWIVQETTPPYACSFVGMGEALRQIADEKVEFAIQKWHDCIVSDNWGMYPKKIMWADPVAWDQTNFYEKTMMEDQE